MNSPSLELVNCGQKIATDFSKKAQNGFKALAVLVDPDKAAPKHLSSLLRWAEKVPADYIFVGGSLLLADKLELVLQQIREESKLPVILFPGNNGQVSRKADAILFLSLLSGRNPDFLIGQHVQAAPMIREAGIEPVPTAYLLIDGGKSTTASYISQTQPIPADKPEISACTALAGKYLGFQCVYLDAGSGAIRPVGQKHIKAVKEATELPLIVGGGITEATQAEQAWKAGADILVVGNALEKEGAFADELAMAYHSVNQNSNRDRNRHSIHG
jgi:putative glycerol-1-phosphate prenyltransferase